MPKRVRLSYPAISARVSEWIAGFPDAVQWHVHGRSRLLLVVCLLIGVLSPIPASAHVKWFEDGTVYPLRTDLIWSDRTALWLASSAVALVGLGAVQRLVRNRTWPGTAFLARMTVGAPTILAIQAAIGLVSNAVHPAVLAPNLPLGYNAIGVALALVQVLIAMSLVTGLADWLGGLALIALIPVVGVVFSPGDALEQMFWAGIGAVVLVIGRGTMSGAQARPWFRRRNPAWAGRVIAALRVTTGVSLIATALSEKLWNPDLGRAFLLGRPELNVFHALPGLGWFSDDVFVLVAGLTEAAIGVMLISGMLPRLVILAMCVPFHLGIPVLPSQELVGHLPIFGVMYLLLVHGPYQRRVVTVTPPQRSISIVPPTRVAGGARHSVRVDPARSPAQTAVEPGLAGQRPAERDVVGATSRVRGGN